MFGFAAGRIRRHHRPAAGPEKLRHRIVPGLGNGNRAPGKQRRKIVPVGFDGDALGRGGHQPGAFVPGKVRPRQQPPRPVLEARQGPGRERGAQQGAAVGGAAAGRNQDLAPGSVAKNPGLRFPGRIRVRHHPGVMDLGGEFAGRRERLFQGGEGGIAVNEDEIEEPVHPVHGFADALRLFVGLQDVADRTDDHGLRIAGRRRLQERQQLETHLPAAEGKRLDDDGVGGAFPEQRQQGFPAPVLERLVDGVSPAVAEVGEIPVRALHGRQLAQGRAAGV